MVIIDDKVVWMDVPKCATSTIIGLLGENDIKYGGIDFRHSFGRIRHQPDDYLILDRAFISVRHPAEWLRSLWSHRRRNNWNWQTNRPSEWYLVYNCGVRNLKSWDNFVRKTSQKDWLTDYWNFYISQTRRCADLLKCEGNIHKQLEEILGRDLKPVENVNVSDSKPKVEEDFYDRLYENNRWLYERLDYQKLPQLRI